MPALTVTVYHCLCGTLYLHQAACTCGYTQRESHFRRLSDLPSRLQAAYHANEQKRKFREEAIASVAPEARMLALVNSFPCLRRKCITHWDAVALDEEAGSWSYSERLSLDFWDPEQQTAFLAWAQVPWWP